MPDCDAWPPPGDSSQQDDDEERPGALPHYPGGGQDSDPRRGASGPSWPGARSSDSWYDASKRPPAALEWEDDLGSLAPFGAPLARWWQRFGAMLIDAVLIGVITTVVTLGVSHSSKTSGTHASPALTLTSILLSGVYFTILNGTGAGQTLGNRAPGIAVRDAQTGAPIGIGRSFVRWLVRAVLYAAFVIPGVVNDLFPLWDSQNQSLADKAARSVVVRLR